MAMKTLLGALVAGVMVCLASIAWAGGSCGDRAYERTLPVSVWAALETDWLAADERGKADLEGVAVKLADFERREAGLVGESGAKRCGKECTALNVISCIAQLPQGCEPHCCGCDGGENCGPCSKCSSPCAQGGQCSVSAWAAEYEAAKAKAMETMAVGESCFDRCADCHHETNECPDGEEPCGEFQCWHNCNTGKHPVCCHGC